MLVDTYTTPSGVSSIMPVTSLVVRVGRHYHRGYSDEYYLAES